MRKKDPKEELKQKLKNLKLSDPNRERNIKAEMSNFFIKSKSMPKKDWNYIEAVKRFHTDKETQDFKKIV